MSMDSAALRVRPGDGGTSDLLAPSVGIFTSTVAEGEMVAAGQSIGTLEVLGVQQPLIVPAGVIGRVTRRIGGGQARVPVQYGDALLAVSSASVTDAPVAPSGETRPTQEALAFVAPMSGRFYSRPSPTEAPFVVEGDTVQHGQTIGLLEVMKTFNRLVYQGEELPEEAVVERIPPNDGDDVVRGDPILLLAALTER